MDSRFDVGRDNVLPTAHHLAVVMFVDIVGHTSMTSDNEVVGQDVRADLVALATSEVPRQGGRIVKLLGDGFLAEFRGARYALHSALGIQTSFAAAASAASVGAHLRIGLHLADVTELSGGDLHGADVSLASRIQAEAIPGTICVSAHFAAQLQARPEFAFDYVGDRHLKGARAPIGLYTARWRRADEPAPPPIAISSALVPRIDFVNIDDDAHVELLDRSFEAYLELFPDEAERDSPQDIETWLREANRARRTGSPWREVYGVVHTPGEIAGLVYVSCHVESHWCFANYLGIRRGYRQENQAGRAYDALVEHILRSIDAKSRGILFEIETVDFECLERARAMGGFAACAGQQAALINLRRLRRLLLYQTAGAFAFLDARGQPLPYWQPAMSEPLSPENEVPLILMVLPFEQSEPISVNDVLNFVFDDLYGDAYGGAGSIEIPDYRAYVDGVKNRVVNGTATGWSLGRVATKKQIRDLLFFAKHEGLAGQLDL